MPGPASTSFTIAMAVLAVASVAGTLILWTRVDGPPAVRWAARLGLVLWCQLTAVALALAVANHAGGFFLSWAELRAGTSLITGSGPNVTGPVVQKPALGSLAAGGSSVVPAGYTLDGHGFAHAHLLGPTSHVVGDLYVRTPPGYDPHRAGGYPVILLVNGYPGQPTDPLVNIDLAALGSATSTGSIIISATTNVDGQNWGCADSTNGPLVGTWLTHDIPQLLARDFAVRHQSRWAVLGISEGAMCAVRLALTSPTQFAAAISLSGSNVPDAPALSATANDRATNDLRTLAAKGATPPVDLLVGGTHQDGSTATDAWALHRAAGSGVSIDLVLLPQGGHNWKVWNQMIPTAVNWLRTRWATTSGGR